MTWGADRTRVSTAAGVVVAALALVLASPAQPEAASADCGDNSGSVCWENESCVDILFYEQCTTEYRYYPEPVSGGSGGTPGGSEDDGPMLDLPGGPGCTWGDDYVGWEPFGC